MPILLGLAIAYVLIFPDQAQTVAGWIGSGVARVVKAFDKRAVKNRVEGNINWLRSRLLRGAPDGLVEGKLRIKWTDAKEAEAAIDGGDVVIFMRRSDHHAENVTTALMAYLPKALLARSRRYVHPELMRAGDLSFAKSALTHEHAPKGAADVFFERHLDPARAESEGMRAKIDKIDRIDMHGWLLRILFFEYKRLGTLLYPGEPSEECHRETEDFAD